MVACDHQLRCVGLSRLVMLSKSWKEQLVLGWNYGIKAVNLVSRSTWLVSVSMVWMIIDLVGLAVSLSLDFNYDPLRSESTLPPYMPVKIEAERAPCLLLCHEVWVVSEYRTW